MKRSSVLSRRAVKRLSPVGLVTLAVALIAVIFAGSLIMPRVLTDFKYVVSGCPGAWWERQAQNALSDVTGVSPAETYVAECYGSQTAGFYLPSGDGSCSSIREAAQREDWEVRSVKPSPQKKLSMPELCDFVAYRRVGGIWSELSVVKEFGSAVLLVSNIAPPTMLARFHTLLPDWSP